MLLVSVRSRNKHVLVGLDDSVTCFKHQHCWSLEKVIRHVKVNIGAPSSFFARRLVALGIRATCNKDTIIRNLNTFPLSILCLTPFEVEDVVVDEVPLFTKILSDVQFFIYLAWLVLELFATGPARS